MYGNVDFYLEKMLENDRKLRIVANVRKISGVFYNRKELNYI